MKKNYLRSAVTWAMGCMLLAACHGQQNQKTEQADTFADEESLQLSAINDYLITCNRVGIINSSDTQEDLLRKFGKTAIQQDSFFLEGQFQEMVSKVDAGKPEELVVHWKDDHISQVQISQPASPYHFMNGVKLQTSLAELVKLNQKPVRFYGFGWDYGGAIASFSGGTLEKTLPCFSGVLQPDSTSHAGEKYAGDTPFVSDRLEQQEQEHIRLAEIRLTLNAVGG